MPLKSGELTKQHGFSPENLDGATRIGATWLHVPPINIHFNNPKFEDINITLRQQSQNHIKTGRALWTFDLDLVFTGVDMINSKLAPILAQIRRTPFLTIYNETIRKMVSFENEDAEIPIAVTGYTIHTELDLPDTLIMRLSFMLFGFSPITQSWRYLKQTLDGKGNAVFNTPAINIEDSNLYTQYYKSLLVDYDKTQDMMFGMEIDPGGYLTKDTNKDVSLLAKDFSSRIDLDRSIKLRNGSAIRKVSSKGYKDGNQSFSIGYHVGSIDQALDLTTGAYLSRRLKGDGPFALKWVSTEADLRKDVLLALKLPDATTTATRTLIGKHLEDLQDLAVFNNANKYVKRFTMSTDANKNIEGIAVRRGIPISILPIVSSAIPTCQFMGGSSTDITFTIQTSNEKVVELLTFIDRSIEESQRNVTRNSGSELTYLDNDIVNLNGTFVVTNGNMDIQNIPENPGSYIITWNFSEQSEVLSALISPAEDIKSFKKSLVKIIMETSAHANWNYNESYDKSTGEYVIEPPAGSGKTGPSFIHTFLIPSFVAGLRNGFVKFMKNENDPVRFPFAAQDINRLLYNNSLVDNTPPSDARGLHLFGQAQPGSDIITDFQAGEASVMSRLWHIATNQIAPTHPIDVAFRKYLVLSSTDTGKTVQDGSAHLIVNGDLRRFEMLLRSPHLLEYEVNWMLGKTSDSKDTQQVIGNASTGLVDLKQFRSLLDNSRLNCYADLGLPFDYHLEDNKGVLIPGKIPHIFYDPDFYIKSGPPAPASNKSLQKSISQIDKQNKNAETSASVITHGGVPSNFQAHTSATNAITNYGTVSKLTETNPATNTASGIQDTEVTRNNKDIVNSPQGRFNHIKSLKPDEIFLSEGLASAIGSYGAETSNAIIEKCQREHKVIKSTFKDFNVNIDTNINHIIKEARDKVLNDDKYFSLNKAFPTYRLFFRIENSPQWLLFDEFFDYRAVESIRFYRDKASPAATMHIVLDNYNQTLTDLRALMAKRSFKTEDRNSNSQVYNQYTGSVLKSLFVQAGTQVQLKMGYAGNHGDLVTVFNGFVSETSPGEKFEIVCQSYGIELLTDCNVGSFMGWICSNKTFIWWMLMSQDIKHLGNVWQVPALPNGVMDFVDGLFTFDDNIYLNEQEEPGGLAHLQSYNADNMTKWDVLQDIAASRPGYICQLIPFDNRETIFFGHPDHLYKYTQDMGATRKYVLPVTAGHENVKDNIAALASHRPDLNVINGIAQHLLNGRGSIDSQNTTTSGSTTANEIPTGATAINYLQWLQYKKDIETAQDAWIKGWSDDGGSSINPTAKSLLDYCHWVDVLTTVAADPNSGNIQYNLFNNKLAPIPRSVASTPSSSQPDAAGVPKAAHDKFENDVSRIQPQDLKKIPSFIPPEVWNSLSVDMQFKISKSIIGTPIPLNTFDPRTGDLNVREIILQLKGNVTSSGSSKNVFDNPEAQQQVSALSDDINSFFATGDPDILKAHFSNWPQIKQAISGVYNTFGVGNLMAILAWANIAAIVTDFRNNGVPDDQFKGLLYNDIFRLPQDTDLKAHMALRNRILTQIVDIRPEFQLMLAELGRSPLQKPFRNYHLKTSYHNIVNNNIRTSISGMWNRVKVKYKRNDFMDIYWPDFIAHPIAGDTPNNDFTIQAGQTLDDRVTREIVVPIENARTVWQARNYGTSLLAEGVRHMYNGTLTILGDPEVKPYDVVYIHDDYNKMYGPIEVKSVEHIMSAETGFITIIEPHAFVDTLGVSTSWAARIANIFDYVMLAAIVIPFALEIGAGTTVAVGATGAAAAVAEKTGSTIVKDALGAAMKRSKAFGNTVVNMMKDVSGTLTKDYETRLAGYITDDFESVFPGRATEVLSKINATRASQSIPTIQGIGEATTGEIASAMKGTSGITDDAIAQFTSKVQRNALKAGLFTGVGQGLTLLNPFSGPGTMGRAIGLTPLNIVKFLAVAAPIAYYQFFAGIDDDNYACPLHIIPLSFNGEPYYAGLDSLTHQHGIINYVLGQFHKFQGSYNTIGDAIGEFMSGLGQVL